MKILLVYPEYPDTFWSFKHALKFVGKRAAMPPLGLLTVAAMLPKHWEIKLVDTNIEKLTEKDILWAEYIFISAMNIQKSSAEYIISECKKLNAKIVAGGPLFTMEHENFPEVDHFVLNEAELTLPDFIRDLENGSAKKIYTSSKFCDIKTSPMPMYELVKFKHYATIGLQFSRGCPFHCDFCNITLLLGKVPRIKSSEQIIAELNKLHYLGWRRGVFFVDDNFICNKVELKDNILPKLIEWRKGKAGMAFVTELSINIADDEKLMDMMVDAGFSSVFVGIESPNKASLEECNKSQNSNCDLIDSIKKIQAKGMQVQGGFIVGFDNDGPSIFEEMVELIQKSGVVTAMVGKLQAPPKTSLWERLKKENRIIGGITGDNADGSTNIVTKMDIKILHEGYKKILQDIYSPKAFVSRVITFLKNYGESKVKPYIEFQYVLAVPRAIFYLGIIGKDRKQFWKLFFWALFRKPKFFPLAITFAIYGYHFRKVSDLHLI